MSSTRVSGAPVWASPVCLVLTAIGIGLATYLTIAHYDTHVSLVCSAKGAIDCEAVTTSAQSKVFGIPVAFLGLLYFVGMIPWHLPMAWRSADPRIKIRPAALRPVGHRLRLLPRLRRGSHHQEGLPVVHRRAHHDAGALRGHRLRQRVGDSHRRGHRRRRGSRIALAPHSSIELMLA